MIDSFTQIYIQAIEMIKIVTFIAVTITLFYYMFKLYIKIIKAIFRKD
jgi:hypothetical protein